MRAPALIRPLRRRDFALLYAGQTASLVGDGIYFVAIAWQTYSLSDEPSALAAVGLAWSLGMLCFLLVGGVASDRLDRRRVLISSDLVRAAAVGAMAVLSLGGDVEIWHLAVLSFVLGSAEAFFGPSFSALIPQLVPAGDLVQANALQEVVRPLTFKLAGPALGGLLVATVGAGTAFAVDAATFLLAAGCAAAIRVRHPGRAGRSTVRADLRAGAAYVRTQPWLWATLLAACVSLLCFWGPVEVLLPHVIKYDLGGSASDFGVVLAAAGVGGLTSALVLSERGLPRRRVRLMYLAWGLGLLPVAGYAVAAATWQLVALSAAYGAAMSAGMVAWATLLQTRVPSGMLGRVSSLDWFVSIALVPVSFALTAPVASVLGEEGTLAAAGVTGCVATLALYLLVPGLRSDHERGDVVEEPRVGDRGRLHADDLDPVA